MIQKFVKYYMQDPNISEVNILFQTSNSITFGYPCQDTCMCNPYVLEVQPAKYRFECWGSIGAGLQYSIPGYGGYTSGEIVLHRPKKLFVYVGNTGYFNALKYHEFVRNVAQPGGATDVRLAGGEKWWNLSSLISRIMVAAGGGGSEWKGSIGGNGGGLIGGPSIGSIQPDSDTSYDEPCPGASQTSGSQCPTYYNSIIPTPGEFGGSLDPKSDDF